MTLVTTRFYNAENKCYREHRGEPRKAETFDKNSADATRIEIWYTGAYSFGQKSFTKIDGRWVGQPEGSGETFYRDVLACKKTQMHITREQVSNDEAQAIIKTQVAKAMDAAREAIAWCKPEDENDENGRYWLSAYRGAQTYRLIVKDGKILGSIPGGFHGSRRIIGVCDEAWRLALLAAVEEKTGTDYHLPKADGSGTYFYLRNREDAEFLKTREYDVPSAQGSTHHNIEITK
jgi:hypothetical protein